MDSIFEYFVSTGDAVQDEKRTGYASWFIDTFPPMEFDDEDAVMYSFVEYCRKCNSPVKKKYWAVYSQDYLKKFLVRTKIHLPGTEQLQYDVPTGLQSAVEITAGIIEQRLQEAIDKKLDVEDFNIGADTFMGRKFNERFVSVIQKAYTEISNNKEEVVAVDKAADTLDALRVIYDKAQLEELSENPEDDDDEGLGVVCTTGLAPIDKDMGGLRYTWLLGVEAQSGGGKTRFVLGHPVYRALMNKKNVLFFALEQSKKEIRSMLIARHVKALYNIYVDALAILDHKVPEEFQPYVEAAKVDLFESGKYGKLYVQDTPLYVETMIARMKHLDKIQGPFDLIAIDYMALIEQQGGKYSKHLEEYQIISFAMRAFKRYVKLHHKAGIAISQLNEKGIIAGKADNAIQTNMAQGGPTVYRNTDYNIEITCTEEMEAQHKRRISQAKRRNSEGFPPFICDVRMGVCYFFLAAESGKV